MLFYTPITSPGQDTAQEVRSGLGDALPYAPRACPVAAVGCSVAALAVIFLCGLRGLRGSAAMRHCFMSIYTHSNQQEPLVKVGGRLVKQVKNRVTTMRATSRGWATDAFVLRC